MKSVATAVCSQAMKSDSARNSICRWSVSSLVKTWRCPFLLKFSTLWCHINCFGIMWHSRSVKLTPLAPMDYCALLCPRRKLIQIVWMSPYNHLSKGWGGADKSLSVNYQLIHYVHLINACSTALVSFNSHMSVIFACNPTAVETQK